VLLLLDSTPAHQPVTILRSTEPKGTFRVTYETITAESAECGDYAECGWLSWLGTPEDDYAQSVWDLRDLTDKLAGCYAEGTGETVPGGSAWTPAQTSGSARFGVTLPVLMP
jgi:hypothetical protein